MSAYERDSCRWDAIETLGKNKFLFWIRIHYFGQVNIRLLFKFENR